MGLIPEDIISQVIDRSDIVETIASYIPLKRAGRNFKALCPFHHEKTPSFVINPDKQIFHCFGCGVGGNVVSYVMHQENVDFPDAIKLMAQKAGITIPENDSYSQETLSLREIIYKINDLAAEFFYQTLIAPNAHVGPIIKYLKERGVSLETVKKFKLGFAQDKWDLLLNHLKGKNINISLIEKSGLIVPQESREGFYDRFRDRIIFPIFDIRSRCVGFGARATKEGVAKYINSSETAVFTKGHHLYGFHIAKESVREKDFVVIVEGYMDFLIPFQAGVSNIVASLGTALTIDQIRLLRRYTQNIVMLFDADVAGENAMVRSLDLLIEEGMNVKIATLSTGEDPDSFVRKFGVQEFHERIAKALPLFEYKLKILMGKFSHTTVEGKTKISTEMLTTINRFSNAVMRYGYVKQLAGALSLPEEALLTELQKISLSVVNRRSDVAQPVLKPLQISVAERSLLKLMLEDDSYVSLVREEIDVSDFNDAPIRKIVSQIFEMAVQGKKINLSDIMDHSRDTQLTQMISEIVAFEDGLSGDKEKICRDCIGRLKDNRLKSVRRDLLHQIRQAETAGDEHRLDELKQKFNQLIKRP